MTTRTEVKHESVRIKRIVLDLHGVIVDSRMVCSLWIWIASSILSWKPVEAWSKTWKLSDHTSTGFELFLKILVNVLNQRVTGDDLLWLSSNGSPIDKHVSNQAEQSSLIDWLNIITVTVPSMGQLVDFPLTNDQTSNCYTFSFKLLNIRIWCEIKISTTIW